MKIAARNPVKVSRRWLAISCALVCGFTLVPVRAADVSGFVRYDSDGDGDLNDPDAGIERVLVSLFTDPDADGDPADGSLAQTNLTSSTGAFTFPGVADGSFVIVQTDSPGYRSTADSAGANDNRIAITVAGVNSTNHVFLDQYDVAAKKVNATNASSGDTLTYTITPYYPANNSLINIQVTDGLPTGTTYVAGSANAGATFTNGVLTWSIGSTGNDSPGIRSTNFIGAIGASRDTYINAGSTNANYSTEARIDVNAGTGKGNTVMHSLIAFDLSGIPSDASVTSAWLRLEVATAGRSVNVYRVTTDWTGTGASWGRRDGTNKWAGGGAFSSTDYDTAVLGVVTTATTGVRSNNVLSTVQSWVQGTVSNQGFVLMAAASGTDGTTEFYSSEEATASRRPSLYVGWYRAGTSNRIDITPNLVGGTSVVKVTMSLWSPTVLTNVTPSASLTTNATSGITATLLSGPEPASATVHTTPVSFVYYYQVVPGSTTGRLSFTGGATATGGTFSNATSDLILVAPQLTFQALIADTPGISFVTNRANWSNSGGLPNTNSLTVTTRLFCVISGQVREDVDGDGDLADADAGITNATLGLWTDPNGDGDPTDGIATSTNVTDASGNYRFSLVPTGRYVIVESDPTGYQSTGDRVGANDNRIALNLPVIQHARSNDFLDVRPVTVSGQVREDADGDGDLGDPDAGIAGVTVTLFSDPNGDGNPSDGVGLATNVTDGSGAFSFTNILPGTYVLVEENPADHLDSADSLGANDNRIALTVTSGNASSGHVFLDMLVAVVSGYVRDDTNGAGNLGGAYAGISGVVVRMYTDPNGDGNPADGVAIFTNTTDATGYFLFPSNRPGNIVLVETDPAGYLSTADSQGANDNRIALSLASGGVYTNRIFLDTRRANISGQVRHDVDGDGSFADADSGISNVTVTLFTDPDGDGDPADGAAISTNLTDSSGNYAFNNLVTGLYVVVETDPSGYVSTADSDAPNDNRIRVVMPGGQHATTNHFLDARLLTVSGQVRHDVDGDGDVNDPDSGLAGVSINFYTDPNADGNPADGVLVTGRVTDASGSYSFGNVFPGSYVIVETDLSGYTSTADSQGANDNRIALSLTTGNDATSNVFLDSQLVSISGQVRHDLDADGDFNDADGGITNVTIVLWTDPNGDGNPSDGVAIRTNVTDSSGNYVFSGVTAGRFVIVETDPAGYSSTADTQGANDNRIAVTLTAVLNSTGNNFLDSQPVRIGGQVRNDIDVDGDFNDADAGLAGATIHLYTDPDRDGDPADGAIVGTNITTSTGYFTFTNILAGGYVLVETDPAGYTSTADSQGANDNRIALIMASGGMNTNNVFLDASAYDNDLPGVTSNMETIVAGSWIIPMDNSKQNIGSAFNLKAYGLLASLLHSNIPVKWVIRTGKAKDEADFTAYGRRIYPSVVATASNIPYRAGPFIIPKIFTNQAAAVIAAYGNNVAVYELLSNVTVDVRYTINTRPVVAALNDGGTIAIHLNALIAAGFVEGISYYQRYAYSTNPISTNSCYSFASEPHFEVANPAPQAAAIRAFVSNQGNFLAQCIGVYTYENEATNGRFHTSHGIIEKDNVTTYTYPNADMPFNQFEGDVSDEGGSLHEWSRATNSSWINSAFIAVQGVQDTNTVRATQAKVIRGRSGGNLFYLGGHDYNGTTIGDINGRRMYMNAVFVPSLRPENCQLTFGADLAITKTDGSPYAPVGSTNVYTIVITNRGPDAVLNARVTDAFPPEFAGATWSASGTGGAVIPNTTGSGNINELIDLPAYGSVTYYVTGLVLYSSSCLLSNSASVSVPENVVETSMTNNRAYDVSITHVMQIGGYVRNDQDGDGDLLDADPGISNVTVRLYTDPNGDGNSADGALVGTIITDVNGWFLFSNIVTGRYVLEESDPVGYLSTADIDGTNDNRIVFNNICGVTPDSTNNVFLDSRLGSIFGEVREDADGNGSLTDPDTGISNVVIVLWTDPNGDGNPADGIAIATNITTATGAFSFIGIDTGRYVIVETDPAGYNSTADSAGANDNQIALQMPGGQNSSGHIFLDTRPVEVAGQVREDMDGDADFTDPDAGIPGVTIHLYTDPNGDGNPADGVAIRTNVTDASGNYSFTNVNAGSYVIVETDAAGYVSTADRVGANDNRIPRILVSSSNVYSNDFLDTQPASIYGQVRHDTDGDGDLTDPDSGLTNVTIRLFSDPNRDGDPSDGVALATNITDSSGNYSFTNRNPGYYVIVETDLSGYQSTADKDGGNFNWITLAHISGVNSHSNDFLDTQTALISGYVREDQYGDANVTYTNPGIAGVTLVLYTDPNGDGNPADGVALSTNVTDGTGFFVFPFLNPGNYVVVETDLAGYTSTADSVGANDNRIARTLPGGVNSTDNIFLDLHPANIGGQVRNDIDGDGDLGDPDSGIASVTIRLYTDPNRDGDPSDGVASFTNVTDASGYYIFTNIYPGYYVVVETDPAGYQSTADRDGGNFNRIALAHRSSTTTNGNDFLDSTRAAIRGQVRNDIDGDGDLFDPDVGIDHVTLTLYTDPNGDGNEADGVLVTTTETDSSGNYAFTAIATGRFVVVETDRPGYGSTADSDPPNDNRVRVFLPGGIDSQGNNFLDDPDHIFKEVDKAIAYAGDTLTYTIYTFYAGNQPLTNVVVSDPVPTGTTYAAASANAGGVFTNGVVTWRLGSTVPGTPGLSYISVTSRLSVSADTYIDDGATNTNFGINTRLNVNAGTGKGNNVMNSLVAFDLSGIPASATLNEAWLQLEVATAGRSVNVYRVTTDWTSGGATWGNRNGTNKWAGGGAFSTSDYDTSVLGVVTTATTGVRSNNMLSTVQGWVQGTTSNRGFALVAAASGSDGTTAFYSTDEGASSRRPSLVVNWNYLSTSNSIDIIPSMISGTSAVQVIMTLKSSTLLTNVTPHAALTSVVSGGVTATLLGGPTPASSPVHTNPVSFTYVYQVTAGSTTGSLAFIGGATASDGSFANATSDRIIVSPMLRFNASVETTPSVTAVTNAATMVETNFIPATNSLPVITLLRSAISGQVREDLDGDGFFADADPGLTNVTVRLYTDPNADGDPSDGVEIMTNVTDTSGNYRFTNMNLGAYVIVETDPADSISTADSQGANDNRIARVISVLSISQSNNFLDTFPVSVSGQVRDDTDADGDLNDSDAGLSNVVIRLFTDPNADGNPADGAAVATNTTDAAGNFAFNNVLPGRYVLVQTDPPTYHATGDRDGGALNQIVLTLTSRVSVVDRDFLVSQRAAIHGSVLEDLDGDADVLEADPGLSNVVVVLYTDPNGDGNPADGSAIATNITTSSGSFFFGGVSTGHFVLVETDPDGFISTGDSTPPNDNRIAVFMPGALNSVSNVFLDAMRITIRGQVREDSDGDGDFNDPDEPLHDASITLYTDPDRDGNPADGVLVTNIITSFDGLFEFADLMPGSYVLVETNPPDFGSTADSVGANDDRIYLLALSRQVLTNNVFLDARFAGISITKASSFEGEVSPGDIITYTIRVFNSSVVPHTGAMIVDDLPSALSYIAGSTRYYMESHRARDDFSSASYGASSGDLVWNGSWEEEGESDGPAAGSIRVSNGELMLSGSSRGISRAANLAGYQRAAVQLEYRIESLDDSSDYIRLLVSSNGTSWSQVHQWTGPLALQTGRASYDISAFIGANTAVRLTSSAGMSADDFGYFNWVEFESSMVLTGQAPPLLVTNAVVHPGQSVVVTFNATAELIDPSVVNEACVTTAFEPVPYCALVTNEIIELIMTQGTVVVHSDTNEAWRVDWSAAGDPVTRDYDIIYVDTIDPGFGMPLTNQWTLAARVRDRYFEDLGSSNHPPAWGLGEKIRFYRAAHKDRWQTTNQIRNASRQVYVAKAIQLKEGENWVSLFMLPDRCCAAGVFGTNLLPAGPTMYESTVIEWYGASTNGQSTNTIWLDSISMTWRHSDGGNACDMPVPLNEGFNIILPPGSGTHSLPVIGLLPTNTARAIGSIQTLKGSRNYNVTSYNLPYRINVGQSGLREAGFKGASAGQALNPNNSDEIRILQRGGGSMANPTVRILMNSSSNFVYWSGGSGSAENHKFNVDDAIIIYTRKSTNDLEWRMPLPYAIPTIDMKP